MNDSVHGYGLAEGAAEEGEMREILTVTRRLYHSYREQLGADENPKENQTRGTGANAERIEESPFLQHLHRSDHHHCRPAGRPDPPGQGISIETPRAPTDFGSFTAPYNATQLLCVRGTR